MGDCLEPAFRSELCASHFKRTQRGTKLNAPIARKHESPWDRLLEAAIAVGDANTAYAADGDLERACARLRMAALNYGRKRGLVLFHVRRARPPSHQLELAFMAHLELGARRPPRSGDFRRG